LAGRLLETCATCDQRFMNIHSAVYNTFNVQRHLLSRPAFKRFRTDAFNVWEIASAAA